MPLPFLAPGDLERCGLPGDGIEIANPLVAEESVLRTSLLPGLVKALATNAARRNTGVGAVGDRPRVPPARPATATPARCPTSARCSAWRSAAATRPSAVRDVARGGRAARPSGRCRVVNGAVAGLHPTRSASLVAGHRRRSSARWARSTPRCSTAHGIGERVGWLEVDLDAVAELPRDPPRVPAGEHLPVERRRPRLRGRRRRARHRGRGAPSSGRPATRLAALRLFDVYRGPGIAPGRRSLAYALRLDAPDHTLTDDEVAEVRARCIAAVEGTLPATLRG